MPEPGEHDYSDEDPGAGEVGRIEALDERFGRIESEQAEHRSLLEQILGRVGGAEKKAHGEAQQRTEKRLEEPPAASVAEQVRRAVQDVQAEQEATRRKADHDAEHEKLRQQAERPPREPVSGFRGKLQRAMYGGDQ
jgi:hypothetical protein